MSTVRVEGTAAEQMRGAELHTHGWADRHRCGPHDDCRSVVRQVHPDGALPALARPSPRTRGSEALAGAIAAEVTVLCTANTKDFPDEVTAALGIEVMTPDVLLSALDLGVRIEPFTDQDSVRAAELIRASRRGSSTTSLSLGDDMCLAVAERLALTVTGGVQHWGTCDLTVAFIPFR